MQINHTNHILNNILLKVMVHQVNMVYNTPQAQYLNTYNQYQQQPVQSQQQPYYPLTPYSPC